VASAGGRGREVATSSRFTLRLDNGELRRIRLGPPWYLDRVGFHPIVGDQVQVTGVARGTSTQSEVFARQVMSDRQTYRMRTAEGVPLWASRANRAWNRYCKLWHPDRSNQLVGVIETADRFSPGGPEMAEGVTICVRTQAGNRVQVHLGPRWHADEQLPGLTPRDAVTVTGCPARWQDRQVLLAAEVVHGRRRVRLRSPDGGPTWPGGWRNWDGWGLSAAYGRLYDPDRVRTISGTVASLSFGPPAGGLGPGLMLQLRAPNRAPIRVDVAPSWFVKQAQLTITPGDTASVTGSLVDIGGQPVMMARELEIGPRRFTVREADGAPVWARGAGAPLPEKPD
jgi:hypothetical protein